MLEKIVRIGKTTYVRIPPEWEEAINIRNYVSVKEDGKRLVIRVPEEIPEEMR